MGLSLLAQAAPPPAAPARVWYGWQILLADAASIGVASVGGATSGLADGWRSLLIGLGTLGYVADGPILHAAHGDERHAGLSGALRLGLPVLGLAMGAAIAFVPAPHAPSFGGIVEGALVGAVACTVPAIVIDSTVFAWQAAPGPAAPATGPSVRPITAFVLDARRERTPLVGLAGSF